MWNLDTKKTQFVHRMFTISGQKWVFVYTNRGQIFSENLAIAHFFLGKVKNFGEFLVEKCVLPKNFWAVPTFFYRFWPQKMPYFRGFEGVSAHLPTFFSYFV